MDALGEVVANFLVIEIAPGTKKCRGDILLDAVGDTADPPSSPDATHL